MSGNIVYPREKVTVFVQSVINPTLYNFDILTEGPVRDRYLNLASTNSYKRRSIGSDEVEDRISFWSRTMSITVEKGMRREKEAAQNEIDALMAETDYIIEIWVSDVDNYKQRRLLFEFVDPRFNQVYERSPAFGHFIDRRKSLWEK